MSELFPLAMHPYLVVAFGLLMGSFANVLIYRIPREDSIVWPGSRCGSCKKLIPWHQNIPVLSYLMLLGKCGQCGTRFSIRYPIVECLVASLFFVCYERFGLSLLTFIRDWPFVLVGVVVTFIDLDHRIIPDRFSIGGMLYGLATAALDPRLGFWGAIAGAGVGFGFFYALAWYYEKRTGRVGLGGGDIKLLGAIGAFVGFQGVVQTILISSIIGSIAGVASAVASRDKKVMGHAIPFGPFLVMGAIFAYFTQGTPFSLLNFFSL